MSIRATSNTTTTTTPPYDGFLQRSNLNGALRSTDRDDDATTKNNRTIETKTKNRSTHLSSKTFISWSSFSEICFNNLAFCSDICDRRIASQRDANDRGAKTQRIDCAHRRRIDQSDPFRQPTRRWRPPIPRCSSRSSSPSSPRPSRSIAHARWPVARRASSAGARDVRGEQGRGIEQRRASSCYMRHLLPIIVQQLRVERHLHFLQGGCFNATRRRHAAVGHSQTPTASARWRDAPCANAMPFPRQDASLCERKNNHEEKKKLTTTTTITTTNNN